MPGANVPDAAQAFEFQDDWSLTVAATRYQLEAVKHTSIERGLIRAVVTQGGQVAVQALYRMRSSGQRLAVELPSGVEFDTEPVRIDGRPTPLESGAKGEFFVPLVGHGGDTPFLLELRYTLPKSGIRVDLPVFRDEPAVQKVYVAAFLPEEQAVLGYHGPWTDEQQKYVHPLFGDGHSLRNAEIELVSWVREGVSVVDDPASSFPVDGQPYLFSTLRPEPGDAGSLRLTTFNNSLLEFLVFAIVIAIGLALLRRPLAERGFVLGAAGHSAVVAGRVRADVHSANSQRRFVVGDRFDGADLVLLVLIQRSQRQQRELVAANAGKTSPSKHATRSGKRRSAARQRSTAGRGSPPEGGSPPDSVRRRANHLLAKRTPEGGAMSKTSRCARLRLLRSFSLSATCTLILLALNARAADVPGNAAEGAEPPQREIFVPFADLHVILSSDVQRVFVTREEYEALAAKAKLAARPEEHAQPAAVLSADYVATIEENRARLMGTLVVTAANDALSAVQLDLSGVALRSATLDDKPAALGRDPAGATVLFVSGAGRHELKLEILAPLETAAAQRTLSFQIPTPPATRIKLTVRATLKSKAARRSFAAKSTSGPPRCSICCRDAG